MKKAGMVSLVLVISVFVAAQVCAQGLRGSAGMGGRLGRSSGSHLTKGVDQTGHFYNGRGSRGSSLRFGSPHVHPHRFGHRHGFGHHHRFGHHHHFLHKPGWGPRHHFGPGGFGFHSFGVPSSFGVYSFRFSRRSFSSLNSFGAAGPPPLGAAGSPPLRATGPFPVVISSPFFCFPHRLSFADQALFVDHLYHFHRIPQRNALSFCRPVGGGNRLIFFGF